MTRRLASKHKVDRRLRLIYGEDQKVHLTQEIFHQVNMENQEEQEHQTTACN